MLKTPFPFDSKQWHHLLLALGLAIWVFLFLFFTEPLDVGELSDAEKFTYLPLYALAEGILYCLLIPVQKYVFNKGNTQWTVGNELFVYGIFAFISFIGTRMIYLYIVVPYEPNPYSISTFLRHIFLPALVTVLPIVVFGRWALGKYASKKAEATKVEIRGEGNYESLKLFWDDLICVKADDNYVEVAFLNKKDVSKQLIRTKLSAVEKAIPDLLRTHRSYLINPLHFQQFKKDNGKLSVELSLQQTVPVSKTNTSKVKDALLTATD
ncbi:LytTR family DNA-binding domain-containing protein [Luteirhabdus pelagi]|uniref:LytTR family DNA-binding domain-containing protein n=1 Tax=Luteirhabdus pelagi TaxID=2792783 RepID=UPI00193AADA6|nr:LytTR family DNA-binding domain-containing protein [Luteirhabdus pelagi]